MMLRTSRLLSSILSGHTQKENILVRFHLSVPKQKRFMDEKQLNQLSELKQSLMNQIQCLLNIVRCNKLDLNETERAEVRKKVFKLMREL